MLINILEQQLSAIQKELLPNSSFSLKQANLTTIFILFDGFPIVVEEALVNRFKVNNICLHEIEGVLQTIKAEVLAQHIRKIS